MKTIQYRQGDVLLESLDSIPEQAKKVKGDTLARGRATGKAHSITDGMLYEHTDVRYVACGPNACMTHADHGQVAIPAGYYTVHRKNEYQHGETVRVQD